MEADRHTSPGPVQLTVIIPVFNGDRHLAEQLDALCAQECSVEWETVVVDNGSTDSTRDIALGFLGRLENLTVLNESRRGKAHALNAGRAAAAGSRIVTLDADDVVAPGYLDAMADALTRWELVCAMADFATLNPPWAVHGDLDSDELTVFLDYLPYVPGGLMGVRASTWDRLGGFTTELFADDVDFSWRAHQRGAVVGVVTGATLFVRRPETAREEFHKARGYGRSHVRLFRKFRGQGMPRKSLRAEIGHLWYGVRPVITARAHSQWELAWHWGLVIGRLEESLRSRTWYP